MRWQTAWSSSYWSKGWSLPSGIEMEGSGIGSEHNVVLEFGFKVSFENLQWNAGLEGRLATREASIFLCAQAWAVGVCENYFSTKLWQGLIFFVQFQWANVYCLDPEGDELFVKKIKLRANSRVKASFTSSAIQSLDILAFRHSDIRHFASTSKPSKKTFDSADFKKNFPLKPPLLPTWVLKPDSNRFQDRWQKANHMLMSELQAGKNFFFGFSHTINFCLSFCFALRSLSLSLIQLVTT